MAALRAQAEPEVSGWSDARLVSAGSTGDRSAFVELYRRHAGIARRAARRVAGNDEAAADAAAEAFARVIDAIVSGRAPSMDFRAYLIASSRHAAIDQLRLSARTLPSDQCDGGSADAHGRRDAPTTGPGPSDALAAGEDSKLVAEAFRGLPVRWRSVLWLTEVEGLPAREAAGVLGISPNNVAQLAVRARARLRERYLQAHVRNHAQPRCQPTVDHLGAYLAGTLADGRRARVDQHLGGCASCRDRLAEVEDLGGSLRRALVPAPLIATGWLWRRRRHHRSRTEVPASVAPTEPRARLALRATAVPGSPVFQDLALIPVSAAAVVIAAGPSVRWALRGAVAVLAALHIIGGIGETRHPVALAVKPSVQPAPSTTVARVVPVVETVPSPPPAVPAPADPGPLPMTAHPSTTVAQAVVPVIHVFAPGGNTTIGTLDNPQPSGSPLVFVVVREQPGWVKVLLPVRPNGSTGWVRRADVSLSTHPFSIVVELGVHRITVFNASHPFLSEPIGVGTADTPTPGGVYYTKELIRLVDSSGRFNPNGPYGPYAYGLSGFSDVLTHFGGGDGVIGIHGTNDASALGHDVSHGCIRMSNQAITTLARLLPLGVPVEIRA